MILANPNHSVSNTSESEHLTRIICTYVQQKRQLAAQSGLFNIKDPTFVELFPDIVQVSGCVCMVLLLCSTFHCDTFAHNK